ncbi:CpaF/VirB11 family protein [Paenibacillus sp. HB172176]|uniref:CpaF/VirB11 family protein n=1 Tax=Paenibacillus sp. HB172176 TaxID=2493690 RepID=UPI00143BFA75|nr:CpaF/VirB11 family protein [Paenibacillus sp. HB172176]
MNNGRKKFSVSQFTSRMQQEQMGQERVKSQYPEGEQPDSEQFERLADEIRSSLSAPRGLNDEQRRQYSETLNRAVLGFAQERNQMLAIIEDRLQRMRMHSIAGHAGPFASLAEALFAEVIGLNVLELVLADKEGLEEIQVVGTSIYEIREGEALPSRYSFEHQKDVERIQQNLVLYNNDRINPRKRWAEVMLRDGSRVTMTGFGFTAVPTLTIRFYTVRSFRLQSLAEQPYRTLDARMVDMLQAVLAARFNIVIIGPTNSGKTNLMKALIAELPDNERLITIENRFEMMLGRDFPSKNIIEYETSEDDPAHASSQAFKLALRQSPKRIIHAEIRDDDANIYVRACTRGHSGSMTTVHANRLEDVPEAITDMCMLDGRALNPERLVKRITEYVTEIGIEMRLWKGRRIISRISELHWHGGEVAVADWAWFDESSEEWSVTDSPSNKFGARMKRSGWSL